LRVEAAIPYLKSASTRNPQQTDTLKDRDKLECSWSATMRRMRTRFASVPGGLRGMHA
jgi:hypothetical protein